MALIISVCFQIRPVSKTGSRTPQHRGLSSHRDNPNHLVVQRGPQTLRAPNTALNRPPGLRAARFEVAANESMVFVTLAKSCKEMVVELLWLDLKVAAREACPLGLPCCCNPLCP